MLLEFFIRCCIADSSPRFCLW